MVEDTETLIMSEKWIICFQNFDMTSFIDYQNPDFEINFIMNEISRVMQS